MKRTFAVRLVPAFALLAIIASSSCGRKLDERQALERLATELNLPADEFKVRSISPDAFPVVKIDYRGAEADVRFRRQDRSWVIDAVAKGGSWQPADRALPALGRELMATARERWTNDVMPRYARTIKLLVGWSELLGANCGDRLPLTDGALLDLHAAWHRTLFVNRGTEFHNGDLFRRDAWRRPLHVTFGASRTEVTSDGADGRPGTADDLRLVYTRRAQKAGVWECGAHYTIPAFVADALGRSDAPAAWNCADMLAAFRQARMLDVFDTPADPAQPEAGRRQTEGGRR